MHGSRVATAYLWILSFLCLSLLASCSTVKSVVTGKPKEELPDDRQHLPVSPEEAVTILSEVAPQHGWTVVSTGDQFDMHGPRGKFFVLEAERFIGGAKSVSGVFYREPSGAYVLINESNGLPEALVEPLITAIKAQKADD
jgi:hypothetical protein